MDRRNFNKLSILPFLSAFPTGAKPSKSRLPSAAKRAEQGHKDGLDFFRANEIDLFSEVKDIFDIQPYGIDNQNGFLDYRLMDSIQSHILRASMPQPATVDAQRILCPMYDIVQSVDAQKKYIEQARYDVVECAIDILISSMKRKVRDDCFHLLMTAAWDANADFLDVFPTRPTTHIICSPELAEREKWDDDRVIKMDEFGVGREYQNWFEQYLCPARSKGAKSFREIYLMIDLDDKSQRIITYPKIAPPVMAVDLVPYYTEYGLKYAHKPAPNRLTWNGKARYGVVTMKDCGVYMGCA